MVKVLSMSLLLLLHIIIKIFSVFFVIAALTCCQLGRSLFEIAEVWNKNKFRLIRNKPTVSRLQALVGVFVFWYWGGTKNGHDGREFVTDSRRSGTTAER